MKLIPKDALVAEIERRLDELYELLPNAGKVERGTISISEACNTGKYTALESFKDYLDTLEVKEVDLEKELIEWHKEHFKKDGTFIGKSGFYLTNNSQMDIAKHFFELGLAQNITTNLKQRISVLKMEFWTGLQTFDNSEMTLSDAYNQGINDILEELGINAQKGEEV